jgi:multiple sugar transport system ATP-binding protein
MKDGFIMQVGTPEEVFDRPANLFVAEFIGAPKMNIFDANLSAENGKYFIEAFGSKLEVNGLPGQLLAEKNLGSQKIKLGVRPEHIVVTKNKENAIEATILVKEMMGSELHLHVQTADGIKLIVITQTIDLSYEEKHALTNGAKIYLTFEGKVMHLFNPETQANLIY